MRPAELFYFIQLSNVRVKFLPAVFTKNKLIIPYFTGYLQGIYLLFPLFFDKMSQGQMRTIKHPTESERGLWMSR